MKYYKRIKTSANNYKNFNDFYKLDKIFPEDIRRTPMTSSIKEMILNGLELFEEVPEVEYWLQEDKLPNEYIVECTGKEQPKDVYKFYYKNNFNPEDFKYIICTKDLFLAGEGHRGKSIEGYIRDEYQHLPIFTYAQWEQLSKINNKDMKKEIIGWRLKEDCKQYEKVALKIAEVKFIAIQSKSPYYFPKNCEMENRLKEAGVLELWFEPVYEEEFKMGDWVIFLPEKVKNSFYGDVEEYSSVVPKNKALLIQALSCNGISRYEDMFLRFNGIAYCHPIDCFRKATPEEIEKATILEFGGYPVTFEKVSSGVRITCNGVTGTLSQLEKIHNFITEKRRPFMFGNVELKDFEYDDRSSWANSASSKCTNLTIGCTTGSWSELVAIIEKAESL